ncbi:MAG: sulfatase-like hydrolase/transferase [Planctomycetales bacterium]|nr:sulfatase-like hydrolase/transferase [Planctomycetales bacterium]
MRPDAFGAAGNNVIQTPNLDALAKRGMMFTRAVCANPICTPSRAELLTGCSGFRNGTLDFGRPIHSELTTWAAAMKKAGYRTTYVGKWHNDGVPTLRGYERTNGLYMGGGGKWQPEAVDWKGMPVTGYRGWLFRDDDGTQHPERGVGLTPNISKTFADAAIELIDSDDPRPFMLHVNFTAPHDPLLWPPGYEKQYDATEMPLPPNYMRQHPFDYGNIDGRDEKLLPDPRTETMIRELTAVYYAVISHMDEQIGRILSALENAGQADNTFVMFTSDHGLGVGSHGIRGKQNMYEHTIGVPLIIAGPGIPHGQSNPAQVYLRELYPTTCELTGIPIPESVECRSFARAARGKTQTHHPAVFGYFRDKQRMIRTDRWKFIHYPQIDREQLFDLANDPHELHDLSMAAMHADKLRELRIRLVHWQRAVDDPALAKSSQVKTP